MKLKINLLLSGLLFAACIANAQQGPPPGGAPPAPPTPQERLNHVSAKLDKELTLTADQKKKVLAAYQGFFTDMDKLRGKNPPPPPPPPGKKEDVDKLVKQRDELVKKALSSEQFTKYQEVEKTMRPPRPPGPPREPQGTPPAAPQPAKP